MNAHGFIDKSPVARVLAGVIAHAAHDRGHGIVCDELLPGPPVLAAFGVIKPALNVLAGGTGVIARRHTVDVYRPVRAPATRMVCEARTFVERDGEGFFHLLILVRTGGA